VDFRTEDQDGMCNTLQVRWTITPKIAPQPWITCSGCGGLRAFESSGKIRLNANGRRLDAWLIYKCTGCDNTWNRTIFERKNVRDVDSATLDALQSNDPDWIRTEAFNLETLKKQSPRIDEFAACDVRKELLGESPGWKHLQIEFSTSLPVSARLDRLLASELKISRARLSALHEAGLLKARPDRAGIWRRRIRDRLRITVDLSDLDDRKLAWRSLALDERADV
jgi:hypothetical protein